MSVSPTRSTTGAVVVIIVLQLLTRATGVAWLALGSAAAGAVVISSLLLRPRLADLEVRVIGPDRAAAGALLDQVVVVTNRSRRPSPLVVWSDRCLGLSPADLHVPALAPGESVRLPVQRTVIARGVYEGPAGQLASEAPFGALRYERLLPHSTFLVHPVVHDVNDPRERSGAVGVGTPMGTAGSGLEVLGLRPWRPGDSARAVSPRASARHGRPVVMERELERIPSPPFVVLASGGRGGEEWERDVSRAASLALQAFRDNRRVLLISGTDERDARDRTDILDFFARADASVPAGPEVVRAAAVAAHPGGSLVLLAGTKATTTVGHGACCHSEVLRGDR